MNNTNLIAGVKKIKKYYWLLAMLGSFFSVYLLFTYLKIIPSGENSILTGDAFHIYVPVIRNFCRNIANGNSIYYSWNNSLGMNTSLNMAFYGAFNPLNILYLIFFETDPGIITGIIIFIKVELAGISFQLFEQYVLKNDEISSVIFSVAYSMCSFQVAFNLTNFIWMDALYLLPFAFLSIYLIANTGNAIPLCLTYAYSFVTQFYMGYVVGIVSFLFFFVGIWCLKQRYSLKKYVFQYVASAIISILISAVVWLPAAYFLLHNSSTDSIQDFELVGGPIDIYNQFFWGNNTASDGFLPNLYCGNLSIILAPFFFLLPDYSKKEKILYGSLSGVLFLSCTFMPLYKMLHAFNAPDGWLFRFSFCISFLFLSLASMALKKIEKVGIKRIIACAIINMVIYVTEYFGIPLLLGTSSLNNMFFLIINALLFVIWSVYLFFCSNKKFLDKRILLSALGILLVCIEIAWNGYFACFTASKIPNSPATPSYFIKEWEENQNEIRDYLRDVPPYYRVSCLVDLSSNSDTYTGYSGLSDFCTTENPSVRKTLSKLGIGTSPKIISNYGLTDFTKMLLGVKTDVIGYAPSKEEGNDGKLKIKEYPYGLSIAYLVDNGVSDLELTSNNAFENNNQLLSAMLGRRTEAFVDISKNNVLVKENGLHLLKNRDGYEFQADESYDDSSILIRTTDSMKDTYIYFDNEFSALLQESMYLDGGYENIIENSYASLSISYIKPFENTVYDGESEYCVVVRANNVSRQNFRNFYVASGQTEVVPEVFNELSQNQLELEDFENGYLKGKVVVDDADRNLLFTTIPYDDGWSVWINNKKADYISLLDGAFIGVKLGNPGEYILEMKYTPKWLKEGRIVSVIGVISLIGLITLTIIKNKKKTKEI